MSDCYWYNQGRCFLEEGPYMMPLDIMWGIIKSSPQARDHILNIEECPNCNEDNILDIVFDMAEEAVPDTSSTKKPNERFASNVNNYHHRPWY